MTKISTELRKDLMHFLNNEIKNGPNLNEAERLLRQLEYKKRGRKVGWRKYKVLKPE